MTQPSSSTYLQRQAQGWGSVKPSCMFWCPEQAFYLLQRCGHQAWGHTALPPLAGGHSPLLGHVGSEQACQVCQNLVEWQKGQRFCAECHLSKPAFFFFPSLSRSTSFVYLFLFFICSVPHLRREGGWFPSNVALARHLSPQPAPHSPPKAFDEAFPKPFCLCI